MILRPNYFTPLTLLCGALRKIERIVTHQQCSPRLIAGEATNPMATRTEVAEPQPSKLESDLQFNLK
jgi:hypothetical protein